MTPKPTLAPNIDASEPDGAEFRRLRDEIHRAVMEALPNDVREEIEERMPSSFHLVSLKDLEPILDRVFPVISSYENNREPIPPAIMRLMRKIHREVLDDPTPNARAVEAWWRDEYPQPDDGRGNPAPSRTPS